MKNLFPIKSVKQKITIFLYFSFLLLLTIGAVAYITTNQLIDSSNAVSRKVQKVQLRARLLYELVSAESSQRGYLLTGQGDYLVPYAASTKSYPGTFQNLLKLADHPGEVDQLHQIDGLVHQEFNELATTINLRSKKDSTQAQQIVKDNTGKNYMDQIRSINANLELVDQNDLVALSQSDVFATKICLLTIICGSLLGLVIIILVVIFINRDLEKGEKLI
ncbi:MAG TPA: CHASE3 domain-containing protein [Candidatus Saccharimonadales bacterium]|nr:CHASE3 domain-containing protein [Candidatus Saccharimonadales bacterium]